MVKYQDWIKRTLTSFFEKIKDLCHPSTCLICLTVNKHFATVCSVAQIWERYHWETKEKRERFNIFSDYLQQNPPFFLLSLPISLPPEENDWRGERIINNLFTTVSDFKAKWTRGPGCDGGEGELDPWDEPSQSNDLGTQCEGGVEKSLQIKSGTTQLLLSRRL